MRYAKQRFLTNRTSWPGELPGKGSMDMHWLTLDKIELERSSCTEKEGKVR